MINNRSHINTQSGPAYRQAGQAMITAVIFFLIISVTIVLGIASPILKSVAISSDLIHSKESYYLASGALEDVLYRVKSGRTVAASESIIVNGYTTTITKTTTGSGVTIDTSSNRGGLVRKMQAQATVGAGVGFNYGIQAGNGGVTMGGGSSINGNIYSNDTVNAISASVTGSIIAADSASLVADQSNETPTTPASSMTFRNTSATRDLAQSFQVSATNPINKIQFYIKKVGTPADATVFITADSSGLPNTVAIDTTTLTANQVTTSYGWVEAVFPNSPSLIPGTTYWVVIQNGTQSTSNYYMMAANNSYASGSARIGKAGAWTTPNLDSYFRLYTGGITSYIGGAGYVGGVTIGTAGVGDAWASTVRGASVQGHIYCTTGQFNNKSCESHASPSPQPLPFSDANMQDWKDDAAAGNTISGNYTVGSAGATLGPTKITGNLTVNGGGTLTLNGPLWVVGNVSISNGGKVALPSSYSQNSETIISDGTITIAGGGSVGSGTSGSFLFVVSTSRCPNDINCSAGSAVNISGGAGAIAVNAQSGNVALSGGASVKAVVGNSITITGGSSVTYDQGLASPSFVSGPSGGYNITSWKEVQ